MDGTCPETTTLRSSYTRTIETEHLLYAPFTDHEWSNEEWQRTGREPNLPPDFALSTSTGRSFRWTSNAFSPTRGGRPRLDPETAERFSPATRETGQPVFTCKGPTQTSLCTVTHTRRFSHKDSRRNRFVAPENLIERMYFEQGNVASPTQSDHRRKHLDRTIRCTVFLGSGRITKSRIPLKRIGVDRGLRRNASSEQEQLGRWLHLDRRRPFGWTSLGPSPRSPLHPQRLSGLSPTTGLLRTAQNHRLSHTGARRAFGELFHPD